MHFSTFAPFIAAVVTGQPVLDGLVGDLLGYQPGYCDSSPYSGILPFLSYAPAENYCVAHYPVPPYTHTYTERHIEKHYKTHYEWETKTEYHTKTVYKHEKRGHNTKAEAWKTWSKGYHGDWTSACSCIQTTPTTTVSIFLDS